MENKFNVQYISRGWGLVLDQVIIIVPSLKESTNEKFQAKKNQLEKEISKKQLKTVLNTTPQVIFMTATSFKKEYGKKPIPPWEQAKYEKEQRAKEKAKEAKRKKTHKELNPHLYYDYPSRYIQCLMPLGEGHHTQYNFRGMSEEIREEIAKICDFEYMGASEYEHEACPDSFEEILSEKDNYRGYKIRFRKNDLFLICKKGDEVKLLNELRFHCKEQRYCKESIYLKDALAGRTGHITNAVGWWSFDGNYLFFKDKNMFEGFCSLFKITDITD
jgi:hypothetical protein